MERNTVVSTAAYPNNSTHFTAEGVITWANRLMGQRLNFTAALNKGVGGNTTNDMLARYNADVAANYPNFDLAFVWGGTNDPTAGIAPAVTIANLQTFCSNLIAAAKTAVLILLTPRNSFTTAQGLQACFINEKLRQWGRTVPGLVLVDMFRDWADPAVSNFFPATNVTADGGHPSELGGYLGGQRIAAMLGPLFPLVPNDYPSASDYYDATYNPTGNRLPNPGFLTGTGGTINNGQGTLVGGAYLSRTSGAWINSEVVASVNTSVAGFGAYPGKQQQLVVAMATGKSAAENVMFGQPITGFAAGDQIVFECSVGITSPTRMNLLYPFIDESDGTNFPISASDGFNANSTPVIFNPTGSFTFRTPIYQIQGNSRTIYCNLLAGFDASAGTAGATIKTDSWQVRKVN